MRVVHLVPFLFETGGDYVGGGERYALELARHMAEVVPTTLVSFGAKRRYETLGRLRIRVLAPTYRVRGQAFNPISPALFSALRGADVVHCHQRHLLNSSLTALFGRLTGKRVFASDLGGGGWDISDYISTDGWYRGHLHISQYSRKVSGHEALKRAHVIMGGVDTRKFAPDESVQRDDSVLFVGRLLPHKGVDDLVEAVEGEMPLELIGQPYHDEFLALLKQKARGKRVTFRHGCDDAALVTAYRRAMCVVLPSVYKGVYGDETVVPELLGQTLLEGMACGTPAICTDVASMPEVVQDGVTGFVVPPNNPAALREKLCWLRDHPVEARRMGEAARQRVLEHFTWPVVVQRCLEIYHQRAL